MQWLQSTVSTILKKRNVYLHLKKFKEYLKNSFVQVDSYRNEEEKEIFLSWVLTAEYHGYPDEWISTFKEAGYTGDYYWTIV